MSTWCRISPLLAALLAGCASLPTSSIVGGLSDVGVSLEDGALLDDAPSAPDVPGPTIEPTPAEEGPLSERVDFYGLSCLRDGPSTWDAADPCSDGTCDYVILKMTCSLLGGAADQFCLAHTPDGEWVDCVEAWAEGHGVDPEHFGGSEDGVLGAILTRAGLKPSPVELSPQAPLVRIARCSTIDFDAPATFDLLPEGIVLNVVGLDHVACASDDTPGLWGGGAAVGGVRVPVDADCMGAEAGDGWELVRDPAGAYVRPLGFVIEEVGRGLLADLPTPQELGPQ